MEREEAKFHEYGRGVAFPARAARIWSTQIILGFGRSRKGSSSVPKVNEPHLLFVIAVPRRMVNDYLVCVGALARVVNDYGQARSPDECRDRGGIHRADPRCIARAGVTA